MSQFYLDKGNQAEDVMLALRELFSRHPEATDSGYEVLCDLLFELRYLPYRPHLPGVEAALEALTVEGEVLA